MSSKLKRFLSLLLAFTMVLSIVPVSAESSDGAVVETGTSGDSVVVTDPVAKIGDDPYYKLTDAFEAAQHGDTITLQRDVKEVVRLSVADGDSVPGVVLDLNGKTWDCGYGTRINAVDLRIENGTIGTNRRSAGFDGNVDVFYFGGHATLPSKMELTGVTFYAELRVNNMAPSDEELELLATVRSTGKAFNATEVTIQNGQYDVVTVQKAAYLTINGGWFSGIHAEEGAIVEDNRGNGESSDDSETTDESTDVTQVKIVHVKTLEEHDYARTERGVTLTFVDCTPIAERDYMQFTVGASSTTFTVQRLEGEKWVNVEAESGTSTIKHTFAEPATVTFRLDWDNNGTFDRLIVLVKAAAKVENQGSAILEQAVKGDSATLDNAGNGAQGFATLEEAIAAAQPGDTITLLADVSVAYIDVTDVTIDLAGNTLTLTAGGTNFYGDATIKNGTINITGCVAKGDCIIGIGDGSNSATLTMNDVNITGDGYSSAYAVLYVYNSSTLNINGGSIVVSNDSSSAGGVIKAEDGADGKINITGTESDPVELTFNNAKIGILDGTVVMDYVDLDITGGANAINQSALTVKNSTLTIKDCDGRALTLNDGDVTIENSTLDFSGATEGEIRFKKALTLNIVGDTDIVECDIWTDVAGAKVVGADGKEFVVTGTETAPENITAVDGMLILPPTGSITPGYTREDAVWGEGGGNAEESLVIELYVDETKIASASLNNVDDIIDGDVYVTWSIPFAGSTDGYWNVEWVEGYPNKEAQPTKVVLYVDGVEVATNDVQMNGPDNLNPVVWAELDFFKPFIAQTMDASGNVVSSFKDFESAVAAATTDGSVTRIEVLEDYTQNTIATPGETYTVLAGQSLTIGSTEGENNTVSLSRANGDAFSIYMYEDGASLTIESNVTLEGIDIVANGFATSGNDTVINGNLKAMSLKQWSSNGDITVNGTVNLGYGDGQLDLAYGNGSLTVNGSLSDTADLSGVTPQVKAGYSGTRGDGNTINLKNTYYETGAWFSMAGSNGTINVDGSVMKVSGGDASGKLTVSKTGNNIVLTNGGRLVVATITLGADNKITLDKTSAVEATTITGAGAIVVDATDMAAGDVVNVTGDLSGFTGTYEVINNSKLEAVLSDDGQIVLVEKKLIEVTYADGTVEYFSEMLDAVPYTTNYPKLEGATVKLLDDIDAAGIRMMENDMVLDLNGFTYTITAGTGSQGTNTSGFQIRSEVTEVATIKNGTIKVAEGAPVVWMFNNYATDFVVENVIVDCTNMAWSYGESCYVHVSRPGDNTQFTGTTQILNFNAEAAGAAINVGGTMTAADTVELGGTVELDNGATLTAREGLDVVASDSNYVVSYGNGVYSVAAVAATVTDAEGKVTGYADFMSAYNAAQPGETVTLLQDAALTGKLTITKAITIDGNDYAIKADETAIWYKQGKLNKEYKTHLIGVNSDNVTLKDITLDCNDNAAGINIYCAQNVVFDNVSITNANKGTSALTVNGSTLTVKNALTIAGTTQAIDISNGSGVTSALGVTVEEGTVFDLNNKVVVFASVADVSTMNRAEDANGAPYFAAKDNAYFYTQAQIDSRTTGYNNGLTLLTDVNLKKNCIIKGTLDLNGNNLTIDDGYYINVGAKLNVIGEGTVVGDIVLTAETATVTGPEGLNVTTTVEGKTVVYADGVYSVADAVASVTDAEGNVTNYASIADAIKAAKPGETVTIFAGDYTGDVSVNKAITVVGETDEEGNNLVNINGKLSVSGSGVTVKNLNVSNPSGNAGVISGGNILIEGCNLTGSNGLRSCYANDGNVTIKDCVITGGTYGVHFDGGNGEGDVIIDGCTITGWTSFGSAVEGVTITDTTFEDGNYDKLRFYQNATVTNCTFPETMSIDFGKEEVTAKFDGCTVGESSSVADVVYLGDIVEMGVKVYVDGVLLAVKAMVTNEAGEKEYFLTLDEAFTAAVDGDEVKILVAGTYALSTSGKNITITGAVDGVVFDNIGAKNMGGANVTFNNVTFDYYPNENYIGLQHSGNLEYNDCIFNGQVFLYGNSEIFNNCIFNQNSSGAYNVWTYAANATTFNNCTFNSAGKSVLVYNEGDGVANLTVNSSKFYASEAVDGKAAIEINTQYEAMTGTTIKIKNSTAEGFAVGSVSGETLWNDKSDLTNLEVWVDDDFVWPVPALPTATVTELDVDELTFALNFLANDVTDAQLSYYDNWYADFVLTVNKDVTFNANGGADGYLSGQYDAYGANWVSVPFEDVRLNANEPLRIMLYASEALNQPGLKLTYNDVYSFVKNFDCGVYFEPEFLKNNPDLEVTLELRMYNPKDETINYEIGKNVFTIPALPTATVTEIEKEDLTFALNFLADPASDDQLDYYGDWHADFVLTLNKDATFNANGGADGYLAGQYNNWNTGWVYVPDGNVTMKANEPLKIMAYAAEMLEQPGLKLTYNDVYSFVKDFDCGVFFTDEYLMNNLDLVVTLELRMYHPKDESVSYVIGRTYEFRPTQPSADMTYSAYGFSTSGEGESYRERFGIDLYNVFARDSLEIKLYDEAGNLVATTSLRETDRDDATDEIARPITGSKTVNVVVAGRLAGSWDTTWHIAPSVDNIPHTAVIYADGELVDTYYPVFDAQDEADYAALPGVAKVASVTDTEGNVTYYGTLQGAINAAENADVVTMLTDITEDVVVEQKPDVKITIDGGDKKLDGTITVNGKSAGYDTAGLTIQNVNFIADTISKEAFINLGGNGDIRYTRNVTVSNCTFTAEPRNEAIVAIKQYTGGCKNLTVDNCTVTGLHSLIQLKNVEVGLSITDCTITDSKNGISVGNSIDAVISGCKMEVDGYGIRADGNIANKLTVSGCTIEAEMPIVVRKTTAAYELAISGANALTAGNTNGYQVIFTNGDDGTYVEPTGAFVYTADEANADLKVFPTYVAKIEGKGYMTLAAAVEAAEADETITLLKDIELTEAIELTKSIVLDQNGKTLTGNDMIVLGENVTLTTADTLTDVVTTNVEDYKVEYNAENGWYELVEDTIKVTVYLKPATAAWYNGICTLPEFEYTIEPAISLGILAISPKVAEDVEINGAGVYENAITADVTVINKDYEVLEVVPATLTVELAKVEVTEDGKVSYYTNMPTFAYNGTVKLLADIETNYGLSVDMHVTTVDLNGHTWTRRGPNPIGRNGNAVFARNGTDMKITNGTIIMEYDETELASVYWGAELIIDDVTLSATKNTINAWNWNATVTVNSGEVVSENGIAIKMGNESCLVINGGTITGGEYAVYIANDAKTASITGGTFTGEIKSLAITKFISGGYFNIKPDESYIADGYTAVESTEKPGYWEIVELIPVTVTINSVDMVIGHAIPTELFGYTVDVEDAVVTVENYTVLDAEGNVITTTGEELPAGTYTITADVVAEAPYVVTKVDGTLTVGLFDISFSRMELDNSLAMSFAFKYSHMPVATWKTSYVEIVRTKASGETQTATIPSKEWKLTTVDGEKYFRVTFNGLAAKEMTDEIVVTVYNADGVAISNDWNDSVRDYAMRALRDLEGLTDAKSIKEATMVVDMLNYGAAAQLYFSHDVNDLANKNLTAEQKALATATTSYEDGRVKGTNYLGTQLKLESNIRMNMAFRNITQDMHAVITYKNHYDVAKSITVDGSDFWLNNGALCVTIDTIVVADGRQDITCTIYDGETVVAECTDSIESYVARAVGTEGEAADKLYVSIMKFSDSAYAYLHAN